MTTRKSIDLHVHSTASDGTLTPGEVVRAASAAGLSAIALTDHDTVSGIAEAREAAAECGIELVPGIELSTSYTSPDRSVTDLEVHIVGLLIDPGNELLLKKTQEFRDCRDNRNKEIVKALQKEGFPITMEALKAENPDCVITRANIARFLYHKGCIGSVGEAFEKYIGDGCPCYVGRFKITPMEAAVLIRQAGGIAVFAHPLLCHLEESSLRTLIAQLIESGLEGIEAVYGTYSARDEQYVRALADEYGLLLSGGSDFHGSNKPAIRLGRGQGRMHLDCSVLEALKARKNSRNSSTDPV